MKVRGINIAQDDVEGSIQPEDLHDAVYDMADIVSCDVKF